MVTIVNYGIGNLRSIESALHYLGFALRYRGSARTG